MIDFHRPPSTEESYRPAECVVFGKTKERFGGLSNMASGFPLFVAGQRILSSEALYQACRFPRLPEVQQRILDQHSPMTAKMVSKPYRDQTRAYWDLHQVEIMAWCLRVKLLQNWDKFSGVLVETGTKNIVEKSRRDRFWGAVPSSEDGLMHGVNMLGKLLMDLRQDVRRGRFSKDSILEPVKIPEFQLLGHPIDKIRFKEGAGQQRL